ncbi:hypothetical protein KUCAC02_021525 [Chaenocephalus aceratus]|uniref:Uncharacterized protein n=1 Tax=Chaenocephalus aceratus TaxID=36190 RepID=A0ACB9XHG4_CHAAC|nr:hypothetical protein KUCAC02_021525 [Chaenocephalus aceratus]
MILVGLKLSVVLVLLIGCTHHLVQGRCSVEHCTDPTRCVLSEDQRSCKCAIGYYGDQCDKDAHIQVMCGRDYITVRALEDFFMYHNVPLESLHLSNKSCIAQSEVIHGVPYYMLKTTKEKYLACGGKQLEKNFTHILLFLSLLSDPQNCRGPGSHAAYDGCVNDQTVVFLNGEHGTVLAVTEKVLLFRYSFDMFRFTSTPHDLYLHCTVQLCEPDDHVSCTPNCKSIAKREAVRADPALGLLSYGPIRIEMPDGAQSSVPMTVVLPVAAVWTVGFFLIILITVAKAGSRRLAQTEEH